MICHPIEEEFNSSTEIEENTNALNKLITTIENKLVITEVKENYNDYEFGGFVRNLVQQYYEMQVKTRKDLKSDYTTLVKKLVGELQLN